MAVAEQIEQEAEYKKMRAATPRGAAVRSMAFLLLLWLLTQFASMFAPPLLDDVDALHAEAAREMITRHDYVTLYVDGIRYLEKPPLPYWLAAGAMQIFGQRDWAVRSILALTMLVLTLYLYMLGRRLFGERAGLYAGFAIATAIGPFIYTRFFIPDIILGLWMTIAFDLILRLIDDVEFLGKARQWPVIAFALVCTAAVLTKGLIGIVFPVGMLVAFLLLTRRLRLLARMRPLLGVAAFFLTALPWHVLIALQNRASGSARGFLWFYFVNDQIDRYLNTRVPRDYDKVPLLLFYSLTFLWILPWGAFLFRPVAEKWRQWRSGSMNMVLELRNPTTLLVLWVLLIVGFFTFSTRQEYYTLPAVPALALLAGWTLSKQDAERSRSRNVYLVLFCVSALLALVCTGFAIASKRPAPGTELAQVLTTHPEDYALSFGHLFDFTASAFGFFRLPLLCMAASLLLPTAAALVLKSKGRALWANTVLALGMCAVLSSVRFGLNVFYPIIGSQPIANMIQQRWQPGDRIVLDGEYSNNSSVNFYTHQPVSMLNGRVNNLWYGSLYADAPNRFMDNPTMLRAWRGTGRVFFITHNAQRTEQWLKRFGGARVASYGGKFLLVNHG